MLFGAGAEVADAPLEILEVPLAFLSKLLGLARQMLARSIDVVVERGAELAEARDDVFAEIREALVRLFAPFSQ